MLSKEERVQMWVIYGLLLVIGILITVLVLQTDLRLSNEKLKTASDALAGVNQLLPEGSPVIPQINNVLDEIGYGAMKRQIKPVVKKEGSNE